MQISFGMKLFGMYAIWFYINSSILGELKEPFANYPSFDENVFVFATGTGFYQQCLPNESLDFAYSSFSLHYLSERFITPNCRFIHRYQTYIILIFRLFTYLFNICCITLWVKLLVYMSSIMQVRFLVFHRQERSSWYPCLISLYAEYKKIYFIHVITGALTQPLLKQYIILRDAPFSDELLYFF